MGEAKKRGSRDDRVKQSLNEASEKQQEFIKNIGDRIKNLSDEDRALVLKISRNSKLMSTISAIFQSDIPIDEKIEYLEKIRGGS